MPDERFIVAQSTSLTGRRSQLRAMANNAIPLVKKALEQTADNIVKDLKANYSTARPGPTYDRTGDLGAGWERLDAIEHPNGSIVCPIINPVTERRPPHRFYASLVQGPRQTFRHNQAGWRTVDEIKAEHSHEQSNRVRAAIKRAGEL